LDENRDPKIYLIAIHLERGNTPDYDDLFDSEIHGNRMRHSSLQHDFGIDMMEIFIHVRLQISFKMARDCLSKRT